MKKVLAMLTALTTKVGKFSARSRRSRSSPSRPLPPRSPRSPLRVGLRRAAFNGNNSGRKFKRSAKLKDGSEDDWFAAWDVKNNVFVASARTAANVVYQEKFGEFGTAHYKSLASRTRIAWHTKQLQLGQGQRIRHRHAQVLRVSMLLPQGEKPRCLSRGTARAASVLL